MRKKEKERVIIGTPVKRLLLHSPIRLEQEVESLHSEHKIAGYYLG